MLSLVIAESALELVPKELQDHNSVITQSQNLDKHPSEILLDNSWHFAAMKGLENELKRGRPDLVHFSLLEVCTTPLYLEQKLNVYVHTIDDHVISIGNGIRLPKSYHRFAGLVEQLYAEKIISFDGKPLLQIKKMDFHELIDMITPSEIIGLSTKGKPNSYENIAKNLTDNSCLVIGGFQKGHFSENLENKIDHLFKINSKSQESHVVLSRILYEYEKTIFM